MRNLGTKRPTTDLPGNELTRRERDIVDLVALGYTNGEIGAALGTSRLTVRNQLANVFRKVGVSTRAELVGVLVVRRVDQGTDKSEH